MRPFPGPWQKPRYARGSCSSAGSQAWGFLKFMSRKFTSFLGSEGFRGVYGDCGMLSYCVTAGGPHKMKATDAHDAG